MVSLRRKLLLGLLLPLLPLLLAGVGVAFVMAHHFVNLAYDRSLFRAALALADQVEVQAGKVVVDLPQAAFDMLEYDKDDWIYYRVTGAQGEFVTGYVDLPRPPMRSPRPNEHYYYTAVYEGKPINVAVFYLPLEGTSAHGMAIVQVAETTAKRERMVNEIVIGMLIPQLLMVLVAVLMVRRGVSRGLRPLDELQQEVAGRSHLDLAPLDVSHSPTEVQPLLGAMNDLMARLEQAISRQQRFVADASHQLRTPLAGLRTQAEIALREHADPQQLIRSLEWIMASSERLAHLIDQLLMLARIEPGAKVAIDLCPLDLDKLARDVTMEWVPRALEKDIDLGFESKGMPVSVAGDAALLQEMLRNLIDNAIRYTPPHGRVTVGIEQQDDNRVSLYVEDDGPGIPPDQRERVFERFYRILGSGEDGCGLGLSIVREIAEHHHGTVSIDGGARRGAKFSVRLPAIASVVSPGQALH